MKRFIQGLIFVLLLFSFVFIPNKVFFRYGWKHALARTLLTPFLGTVWSEDFSESAFAKVKLGMQESEVDALLVGTPIRKSCDGDECLWTYADQEPDYLPYDRRWISFNANRVVVEIRHEFYID